MAGQVCCETQQFYHPIGATLRDDDNDDDYDGDEHAGCKVTAPRIVLWNGEEEEEEDNLLGQNAVVKMSARHNNSEWSCCGQGYYSTGCKKVSNPTSLNADEDPEAAIAANEKAREEFDSDAYDRVDNPTRLVVTGMIRYTEMPLAVVLAAMPTDFTLTAIVDAGYEDHEGW